MAEAWVLVRGFALGVAIAAPVGPVGLLCIRRTIEHGLGVGLATGLGAAVADAFYGAVAAFGVAAVLDLLAGYENHLNLAGGLFLVAVAAHALRAPPPSPNAGMVGPAQGWGPAFASGVAITMANPVTIGAILLLVAAFGEADGPGTAATLVTGVFLGSAAWWLALSGAVALLRGRLSDGLCRAITRITAVALAGFGVWATIGGAKALFGA